MGKAKEQRIQQEKLLHLHEGKHACGDHVVFPLSERCTVCGRDGHGPIDNREEKNFDDDDLKELVVIGAGPHSMSLVLRLLQPDADLMSEKERHYKAENQQLTTCPTTGETHQTHRAHWVEGVLYHKGKIVMEK